MTMKVKRKNKILEKKTDTIIVHLLTPWIMEPGGSMRHSQGLSNNSYPEPNQPNSPH